jgi:hypothetical protein
VFAQTAEFGTVKTVSVNQDYLDQTAFHVYPQDIGITTLINVFAHHHYFGTHHHQAANAHNHISCIMENVLNVQVDLNGLKTDANNATATMLISLD